MNEETDYEEKANRYKEKLMEGWRVMTDEQQNQVIQSFHNLACEILKVQEDDYEG